MTMKQVLKECNDQGEYPEVIKAKCTQCLKIKQILHGIDQLGNEYGICLKCRQQNKEWSEESYDEHESREELKEQQVYYDSVK